LADYSNDPISDKISEIMTPQKNSEIEELRQLITGPERLRIDQIKDRLDDPETLAREISHILPEAILLRSSKDDKIAKSIGPTVEKAIESSIKKNSKVLVDALFPIMGPSIRKAVTSAILGMIQSFDKTLEYSFSLQGLKWRFEALRTKRPFGEIVLINTLLYQVEQVFLIHNETGLVIQHVVSKDIKYQDPDLVSSMLSAIRDFVHDSFDLKKEENLDTLHMGSDRIIWIEQGPYALLAAVIRGTPPENLRSSFRDTLETIHISHQDSLKSFNGDIAQFEGLNPYLEECLQSSYKPKKKKITPLFWILLGIVILLAGTWCFNSIAGHRKVAHYLERLKGEPGILITSCEKHSGNYYVYGMADPMASDPVALLKKEKLDQGKFIFKMEPYNSTSPEIAMKRITSLLNPPETVIFKFSGNALDIQGTASNAWIQKMEETIKTAPWISTYDTKHLIDIDLKNLDVLLEKIENRFFLFEFRTAEMMPGQEDYFNAFIEDLRNLFTLEKTLGEYYFVDIVGHADSLGTEEANNMVSKERADKILSMILKEGFETYKFSATGLGSKEPFKKEKTNQDRELNRRVTIRVSE
jgi:outer membrane protein OmpA-like peptidoglycan-associated protein